MPLCGCRWRTLPALDAEMLRLFVSLPVRLAADCLVTRGTCSYTVVRVAPYASYEVC